MAFRHGFCCLIWAQMAFLATAQESNDASQALPPADSRATGSDGVDPAASEAMPDVPDSAEGRAASERELGDHRDTRAAERNRRSNDPNYRWHNGHWWYRTDDGWKFWYRDRWIPYERSVFYEYYPQVRQYYAGRGNNNNNWSRSWYSNRGYSGYPTYGYDAYRYNPGRYGYGGYGTRYGRYGGPWNYGYGYGRGYSNNPGAVIGGWIEGDRGARIGGAIGPGGARW